MSMPLSNAERELELQDKELFNQIAQAYSKKDIAPVSSLPRKYQTEFVLKPLLDSLMPGRTLGTIVEIACGIGASATYLRGKYDRYVGIDYSDEMVRIAEWYNRDAQQASFLTANIKDVRINGEADVVLAIGALHHMQDLDSVLEKIKNILKPGGWFTALEPFAGNPAVQSLRWLRSRIDSGYSPDQRYFSPAELDEMFRRHGFENVSVQNCNYFTPPFAQVILPVEPVSLPLSKLAVRVDSLLDNSSWMIKRLSWNLAVRAKAPR